MTANIVRMEEALLQRERFRRENPDATQLDRIEILLHLLREEIRIMSETQAQQDAQITSDVAALTTAFTNFQAAVAAEIAAAQASPAAADPVVAQALTNIESLTATMVAATAAAQPAAPVTSDGTPIPTITGN